MTLGGGSVPVRKVTAAALSVTAPHKHDATFDDATTIGARDLHPLQNAQ
jgi:hypothetical protein